jgi:hypothetical protein
MSFNAVTFFGSGEMSSFENVTPKNTTLSLLNSHFSVKATNTEWNWGTEQEAAFEKIKQELSSETVMTYFIPKLDIGTEQGGTCPLMQSPFSDLVKCPLLKMLLRKTLLCLC